MGDVPPRALITRAAADLLETLQGRHGALMFHQSGGCCDGSSPMCYPDGDFIVGDRDILLAVLDVGDAGVPVWISGPQFEAWKHTQLVIDPGAAAGSASRLLRGCGSCRAAGCSPTTRIGRWESALL
jgi:uncharacterized protein